jgi:transposase
MAARYIIVDHDTPLLLTPDLREWVPENHLVHFIMDAVEQLDLGAAKVNEGGTGDAQYPPGMLLALLIYSYATGMFSSRAIERASYENVAVRLLCGDTHPDHDTVCAFRRRNVELLGQSFAQVIEMAAHCGVLKVGGITVAIDGTKILANASKPSAVSYGHAGGKMRELDLEIAELLKKAEAADSTPLEDGLSIPEEVQRRIERKAGAVAEVLIDSGFVSEKAVKQIECDACGQPTGVRILGAVQRDAHGRTVAQLEKRDDPPAPPPNAPFLQHLAHRVATQAGRQRYRQRQQTVEPVFGIIKQAPGFRRFSLRGLAKVRLEWTLVTLAYNLKRLFNLQARLRTA